METLNEHEYLALFALIKESIRVVGSTSYSRHYSKLSTKKFALQRTQRCLSFGHRYNKKLYKIVRDAKRSIDNPTMANLLTASFIALRTNTLIFGVIDLEFIPAALDELANLI